MAKHKRLRPIGDYLYDKEEMIEQVFSSIPMIEIRNMVPIKLQGMPLHELKAECLIELLGISDRDILNILNGKKEKSVSSSDSEQEGAFVISDDERKVSKQRIKKEKKDSARKIKTERVSSKKDGDARVFEPSTSKKKRKSKEAVEVSTKKKKSVGQPAVIPPTSSSKVPVSKKKKDEKKKDTTRKKDEDDDVVVLDDDSDREEKREQKSLLDLLELEMRARAIRSLLKKEEAVHAQKILSEYKDEPDDLIPIDIEPPQIELLSDSEGEEATVVNTESPESTAADVQNDRSQMKQSEDSSGGPGDRECSWSTPDGGHGSVSCDSPVPHVEDNSSKPTDTSGKLDVSEPTGILLKKSKDMSSGSNISGDIKPVNADELSNTLDSAPQCSKRSKQPSRSCAHDDEAVAKDRIGQGASEISPGLTPDKSTTSCKDREGKFGTGHFLVIEESSNGGALDGSHIEEPSSDVNTRTMKQSCICSSDEDGTAIGKIVSPNLLVESQRPTKDESPQFPSKSEGRAPEYSVTKFLVRSDEEKGAINCDFHIKGLSWSNTPKAKANFLPSSVESSRKVSLQAGDPHSQFEEEALDYDYNPNGSCCDEDSQAPVSPSPSPSSSRRVCGMLSLEKGCCTHQPSSALHPDSCEIKCEMRLEQFEDEPCQAREVRSEGSLETNCSSYADEPEKCAKNPVQSAHDSPSVPVCENCRQENYIVDISSKNDVIRKSSLNDDKPGGQLETINAKREGCANHSYGLELSELFTLSVIQSKARQPLQMSNEATPYFSTEGANPNDFKNHEHPRDVVTGVDSLGGRTTCVDEHECTKGEVEIHEEQPRCIEPSQMTSTTGDAVVSQLGRADSAEPSNKCATDDCLVPKYNISQTGETQSIDSSSGKASASSGDSSNTVEQESSTKVDPVQDGTEFLSGPSLSIFSNVESNASSYTILPEGCKRSDCSAVDSSTKTTDELVVERDRGCRDRPPVITNCSLNSSNGVLRSFETAVPFSGNDIFGAAQIAKTQEMHITTYELDETHPRSQDPLSGDVTEIIDITKGDHVESSDVVCVTQERVDSDSMDESDNEISDKAALVLARMSDILNNVVDRVAENRSCENIQPHITTDVHAEVPSVNSISDCSGPETDDDSERGEPPDKECNAVVEVSDLGDDDHDDKEETKDGANSDTNTCQHSIEVIDDSESVCSVDSQPDGSQFSDDCVVITAFECSESSHLAPAGSESDDCVIVSEQISKVVDESAGVSKSASIVEAKSIKKPFTATDKNNVMVTIVIEDDDGIEEEVQLVTEEAPAEILELNDDDEVRSNWTARWLESDNVKKVVQTSKILTNARKQMKMKLKKIEAPVSERKLPAEKFAPSLIGSVEEYHRLVKEGVIFSKASQNGEKDNTARDGMDGGSIVSVEDSANSHQQSVDSACAANSSKEGPAKQSDRTRSGKKKKSDEPERKSKSDKAERRRKFGMKKKTGKYEEIELGKSFSSSSVAVTFSGEAETIDDESAAGPEADDVEVKEDSEIIDSPKRKPPASAEAQGVEKEHTGKVISGDKEHDRKKDVDGEERDEGEASDKEDGEISDSGDEGESEQSHKPSQPCSSMKPTGGSKDLCRTDSRLSCIPLPARPPAKKQPNKTPERNSVAKRFILRNLQLGKKKAASSRNKKKRKKGAGRGNKKGLGCSSNAAPKKNKPQAYAAPQNQTEVVSSLPSTTDMLQPVSGIQPTYMAYPGLAQPGGSTQSSLAQNASSNVAQTYESYYSLAYSQGLTCSASGNYGYGAPDPTPDPNVYKQWEEYYRKLMEACKASAEHASGAVTNLTSTEEKSGYTWVFDHSTSAPQTAQTTVTTNPPTEAAVQVQPAIISSDSTEVSSSAAPLSSEMSEKDRFESWQYRYGLKGLLKEHFIPGPSAPSGGGGSQMP